MDFNHKDKKKINILLKNGGLVKYFNIECNKLIDIYNFINDECKNIDNCKKDDNSRDKILRKNNENYNFVLRYNGKIIPKNDTNVIEFFNNNNIIIIEKIGLLKGGGLMDFLSAIFDIGHIFVFLGKGIYFIIKMIIWLIRLALYIVLDFLSPAKIINDFLNTIKMLTYGLIITPVFFLFSLGRRFVNSIFNNMMSSLWGWDQIPKDSWDYYNSQYLNNKRGCNGKKCYSTKSGKVPFTILMGTIICPPIGVFMEYGATGWINIIVCIILTLIFYFPGLMYALICIYS
jgi:uncharacterized membrane protein YqaE (UPF0057 family)